MRIYDIIKQKRDGQKLSSEKIHFLIDGFVHDRIPDYQMSAFLMAVFFKGMDDEETFWLTEAMCQSGDQIDLKGIKGFTIDKHSTGGVGDKTSLVLAPVLAALGLKVAKLSGRGLGHTGGTIDKLESIRGFSCDLSSENFINTVNSIGLAIVGQTANLVPADKKIYALRDVTATVDSIPLIAASIMSKKLAVANKGLVLDVKVGSGAFMKTLPEAKELACCMVRIGKQAGRRVTAVLSNMDEPLGETIGNALEVKEAIDTLQGKGPKNLMLLVKTLATQALLLSSQDSLSENSASAKVEEIVSSGKAFAKFVDLVKAQGGDLSLIENPSNLPSTKEVVQLESPFSGYISKIDCEGIGISAMMLGAGRETKESKIDPAVGLKLLKHVGDEIKVGDTLAEVHVDSTRNNLKALEQLLETFSFEKIRVKPQSLILDIIS